MITYDVLIYEGGDLAAALTDPAVLLVSVDGMSGSDAFDLSTMLRKYGVEHCIIPHEEE